MLPLAEASCQQILNSMSTSERDTQFGLNAEEWVEGDVLLPHTVVSRESSYNFLFLFRLLP